jgi:anti-sigma factor RsiW
MSECSNAETRDLLPELLHGRLPADARARVEAHVAGCVSCDAELALLRGIRSAAAATPLIDVGRVAAAVPAYRARPMWARLAHAPAFRIAAAIALLVGSIWFLRRPADVIPAIAPAVVAQEQPAGSVVATALTAELPVGEPLTDLSERDLSLLIDELGDLDAVTPAEADVDFPSIRGSE